MLHLLIPLEVRRLVIYPTAINTRWGLDRLAAASRDLGVKLDRATAVLFHNRSRDTLVLYLVDGDGDRCVTKKLDRGAFLVPVPAAGKPYAVLDASKIDTLFARGAAPRPTTMNRASVEAMFAKEKPRLVLVKPKPPRPKPLSARKLAEMIEEATVDAYGESEQIVGFYTKLDEHLAVPFSTTILGVDVVVSKIDITRSDEIIAICKRGRATQKLPLLDLPLPTPPPEGAAWIEAYRHWKRDGG